MAPSHQGGVAVSVSAPLPPSKSATAPGALARIPRRPLPIRSVNHISFAVPSPSKTAEFFQTVLGFKLLPRPQAFEETFDGAWLCGMGLEIHFIQPTPGSRSRRPLVPVQLKERAIDPRSDHLSFLCQWHPDPSNSDWHYVLETLDRHGVNYLERTFPQDDLRQVSCITTYTSPLCHQILALQSSLLL